MNKHTRFWWLVALLLGIGLVLAVSQRPSQAEEPPPGPLLTGVVYDRQGSPVRGATATLRAGHESDPLSEATTQPDGRYALALPENVPRQPERPHRARPL